MTTKNDFTIKKNKNDVFRVQEVLFMLLKEQEENLPILVTIRSDKSLLYLHFAMGVVEVGSGMISPS